MIALIKGWNEIADVIRTALVDMISTELVSLTELH
jgi:hypothetical protein